MKFKLLFLLVPIIFTVKGQIMIFPIGKTGSTIMPEHGFLPGRKFKYYPTINKYDFKGLRLRVELFDDRINLKLKKTQCSEIEFTNTSEFTNPDCIYKVGKYVDTLLKQSGAIPDLTSTDTLRIRFEAIDSRLIGFGYIRAHGLCQMTVIYHNLEKTYCVDITDADKNSPIGPSAFVTRLTATRIMASASIREIIEQFFVDLKTSQ